MTDKELCERLRAEEHWAIERSEAELKREAEIDRWLWSEFGWARDEEEILF